jgi:hypothetical protein
MQKRRTVSSDVSVRSSDTSSGISDGSVGLSWVGISVAGLTQLILSVVLGLGESWGNEGWSSVGDGSWGSDDLGRMDNLVDTSGVGQWKSRGVLDSSEWVSSESGIVDDLGLSISRSHDGQNNDLYEENVKLN